MCDKTPAADDEYSGGDDEDVSKWECTWSDIS
jgi:hypothetical protein